MRTTVNKVKKKEYSVNMITRTMGAAALLAFAVPMAQAQDAVGYNRIVVPANADVLLSVPFNQDSEGTYTVSSSDATSVTVANASFAVDGYNNSHYIRLTNGDGEGLWTTIVDTGASTLTLEETKVLDYIVDGTTTFRVYPHHTLGSLFPSGMYGVSYTNGTQVLIYENDLSDMRQNRSSSIAAAYTTSDGGRWGGADGVSSSTVLKPETRFILRNNDSEEYAVIMHGAVPDYNVCMLIAADGDLVTGSGYPVPVTLDESELGANQRQVLLYDNTTADKDNRSASTLAAYTTDDGGRWTGAGVDGTERILPSESFTLRLPSAEAGTKISIPKPY